MSKSFSSILFVLAISISILQLFSRSNGQDISASISFPQDSPGTVMISGGFLNLPAQNNLSFLLNYGDISGLGERISNVQVFDVDNNQIKIRKMIPGEYLAEKKFTRWSYHVDLTPLKNPSGAAHVSWLGTDGGILMLDDLLPQLGKKTSLNIGFGVRADWSISDNEKAAGPDTLGIPDAEKAVFFVYRKARVIPVRPRLELNITGEWLFSDNDAAAMAGSIFNEYERLFGSAPSGEFVIGIRKFPVQVATDNWEADTRGRTVTVISSDTSFKSQSLQQLHEQLRHEIFHYWIPNGVNLTGNYDWFYEGFALYQSLKTGVALNRIRFDDYLDTLSRAYDIDRRQGQKVSLIDASKNRWNGLNTQVYARGMLVAFLCDLALLENSKEKRSTADLLRPLYEHYRPPNRAQDGNAAVLSLMRSYDELKPIIDRNIIGAERVDWEPFLRNAGLVAEFSDQTTKLKAGAKLSGRQKELLDKLGYNNWRKLALK